MWRVSAISHKETQMKLGDLIKNSSWLSVEVVFSRLFPDQITYLDDYRTVYDELRVLKPTESGICIIAETVIDDFDNEEFVSVSGYDSTKTPELKDKITESLALEFTSWSEWLGMTIDNDSIMHFSPYEIICHCLNEMTFMGFNQKEIKKEWEKIKKAEQEFKHMTKEEKERSTMTLEELKQKYKIKDK
jgi:hypothetical protein